MLSAPAVGEYFRARQTRCSGAARQAVQQIVIAEDAAGSDVNGQHLARAQTLALDDLCRVEVGDACLRSGDEPAVGSACVTHGTQTVAIELGSYNSSVTENHSGGTIPWLAYRRERLKISSQCVVDSGVVLKRRWRKRKHGGFGALAAANEDLQRVIEAGRVADVFLQSLEPVSGRESLASFLFACMGPAAIADDGVDFTVVRQETKRLRQR